MAAMTSFHAEKCCYLVSTHAASARRLCSSVRQFLICSAFVLYVESRFTVQIYVLFLHFNIWFYPSTAPVFHWLPLSCRHQSRPFSSSSGPHSGFSQRLATQNR